MSCWFVDVGFDVVGFDVVGFAVVELDVVGFDYVVVEVRLPSTLTRNWLARVIEKNPEEEVYMPNLLIDNPVVGAFTMRQPLK